ncbi:MAG TPA: 3-phosphoshikimate 1-carboxyvinyltransferase, partial [Tetragenococcus sp.]|nr:3-phosphoshikimate 1-carboxyvinyltransferase [Tetragenococcus sp.]
MLKLRKVKSLRGTLTVPADKSISHRSIMFGAISQGITTIKNFLRADDCMSTLHAFEALGVPITVDKDNISITGVGVNGLKAVAEGIIDVGNSGTTIRLLSGILAATNFTTVLTGDASLKKRPMDRIASPLEQMQVQVTGQKEQVLPPIEVVGNPELKPITYVMPVASAQVKSAILFAALAAKGKTTIIEKEISRNHTEEMIQQFGGKIQRQDKMIQLTGPQQLTARQVIVPGDISSAAFFLAAGALVPNSKIILKNVGINSTRTGIIDVLKAMGAS